MKFEELYNNLGEDVKVKLRKCRTKEEICRLLESEKMDSIDDEFLDRVLGGMPNDLPHYKPPVIP